MYVVSVVLNLGGFMYNVCGGGCCAKCNLFVYSECGGFAVVSVGRFV